ncbi:hypothetical protein BAUCODRAFT_464586 [Baudoinia panamericana UAMH 10762]|uniref:Enolase-phosphatase E1 n=1 Tax=Baudoinia panamericana (strain UAMH 10762) TaxID=717646 RepID=M2MX59_BAUPA|nr:uncharacterized protein BAUCODRAFT_464586 [Baudoinia panamericana UAMH 10762]EMC96133.1 hypothetical protein BAUCODRAFT_464586 [Baudoinia panamericana UAMH 10762]
MNDIENVLLDIEGTVCPISFVKDTLFPYAIKALPEVLSTQWDKLSFLPYRDAFPAEHRSSPAEMQAHVEDLTKRDVKIAYLKNLQGYLWEDGYKSGAYSTPLFPDVIPQLERWRNGGVRLAIYSSGSVFAQKLLFAHVQSADAAGEATGDFTFLIVEGGWFDTVNAGLKTEAASYRKIVETMHWSAGKTLFLTDNVKEYDAAISAGLQAVLLDRPGNAPVAEADRKRMRVVGSLDDIDLGFHSQVAENGERFPPVQGPVTTKPSQNGDIGRGRVNLYRPSSLEDVQSKRSHDDVGDGVEPSHIKRQKASNDTSLEKLVCNEDKDTSPEEQRAKNPKYAFDRSAHERTEFVMGDISGAVTAETEDVVRDPQDTHP